MYEKQQDIRPFKLSDDFLASYKTRKPDFGFNGLGELTYKRTYARIMPDGNKEDWWQTIRRVVEGVYTMQKKWIILNNLGWDNRKAQNSAQEMYERMFSMKFLPSGRGLWAWGTPITEERGIYMALNSCAMVSTENIKNNPAEPFCFLMDASMLGVGVGFDTRGAGKITINTPKPNADNIYQITDDREGWVISLEKLLNSYLIPDQYEIHFDYSLIRPEGEPIKGFGGISNGYKPLEKLHNQIRNVLDKNAGEKITTRIIVDIMNMIGACVVSGNVRRTALISLGEPDDNEFLNLKNYELNPERMEYGWTSNNSVFAQVGMDYSAIAERIKDNGEPGIFWLENSRAYSRMCDAPDWKDKKIVGANPCMEQSLENHELCMLVETFPNRNIDLDDYKRTLKFAYLYAKTVTLAKTHWEDTNRVMLRNRRIGLSMSGLAQFITDRGLDELKTWCEEGYKTIKYYDEVYSDWLAIPKSIKVTTVKPSGTVSLLAGATPGIHYPESQYYIRRVRLSKHSDLIKPLQKAGYKIEPAIGQEDSTLVVEFPVTVGDKIRTVKELSMWEQLALGAFMQKYWSDNQVSQTVTFDPETEGKDIANALNIYQYQLKGVSFLPRIKEGVYQQMPYEAITKEEYEKMLAKLKPLDLSNSIEDGIGEQYCNNDVCTFFGG
ncbi:MAG: fused protease/ribonucleoside-triphosphate reductase [Candidatus Cloacimonas sp.]|nr:fused protease/ribonucleoside-triphosphate reductase [Candidatus Cloacimonas sp.]